MKNEEREIQELLTVLDNITLNRLPCFWDKPDVIQFRIGLEEGPQIKFYPENQGASNLYLKNIKGEVVSFSVFPSDENLAELNMVYQYIRELSKDKNYQNLLNDSDQLGTMITNLENIISPIIIKWQKQ